MKSDTISAWREFYEASLRKWFVASPFSVGGGSFRVSFEREAKRYRFTDGQGRAICTLSVE